VVDTVRVAPETFSSLMFMGSAERKEFTRDNRPNNERPQKRNGEGVPVWSVQVAASPWRGKGSVITVTVAMHDDPAKKFKTGEPVELPGLVFGVTAKRDGTFVTWFSADAISAVSVAAGKPSVVA
jgi:hypothetical protein